MGVLGYDVYLAEDDVAAVQPGGLDCSTQEYIETQCTVGSVLHRTCRHGRRWRDARTGGDEELGAVGVLARVGHGQVAGRLVLDLEVLVLLYI